MRNLKKDVTYELKLRNAFEIACQNRNETAKQKTREKHNDFMEEIREESPAYQALFEAALESARVGNKIICYDSTGYNIEAFVETLKQYGVKKFAFASSWSDALNVAIQIQAMGFKPIGMEYVNCSTQKFMSDEYETKAALIFKAI